MREIKKRFQTKLESLQGDLQWFLQEIRTKLKEVQNFSQVKHIISFREEQQSSLKLNLEKYEFDLKSEYKEIDQQSRKLFGHKKALSKLYQKQTQIGKEIQGFKQFRIALKKDFEVLQREMQQPIQYTADESLVGEQCGVCLEDIKVGMKMTRLSCKCRHFYCPGCIAKWLVTNNNCPNCRHSFD